MKSYDEKAEDDAWEMVNYFEDEIIEAVAGRHLGYPTGITSDVIDYNHEHNIDRSYNLQEAAQLLDELSDYEEGDSGLWDGQDPRTAISTQAAFTYGNAVLHYWEEFLGELNEILEGIEVATVRRAICTLYIDAGTYTWNDKESGFLEQIQDNWHDFGVACIFCEYLEERGERLELVAKWRQLIQDAKTKPVKKARKKKKI